MNLVIDQGNTVTKVAVFENDTLIEVFLFETLNVEDCQKVLTEFNVKHCIYSTVAQQQNELIEMLEEQVPFFIFFENGGTKVPIVNLYKTPKSLGKDRLAAAVEAVEQFPQKQVLVIDAGTAITYEFIDELGAYLGGNISPGITMRFKALHSFTGKLPLIDRHGVCMDVGHDTETAIRGGVLNGVVYEIDSYIDDYKLRYPNFEVILTGGHAVFLESKLKNNTFVDVNFVLKGLNRILNYNVDK